MASVVVLKINFVEPLEWGTFLTVPAGVWWEMQEPLGIFPTSSGSSWIFISKGNHISDQYANEAVLSLSLVSAVFFSVGLAIIDSMVHGIWASPPHPFFLVCSSLEWSMVCFLALPWLLSVHSYINMSVLRENMFSHSLPLKWFKNWYKILANNHTIQTEYDYY